MVYQADSTLFHYLMPSREPDQISSTAHEKETAPSSSIPQASLSVEEKHQIYEQIAQLQYDLKMGTRGKSSEEQTKLLSSLKAKILISKSQSDLEALYLADEPTLEHFQACFSAGADVNMPSFSSFDIGEFPFHRACKEDNFPLVCLMLKNGANPLIRDEDGNNAFFLTKKPEIFEELLKYAKIDLAELVKQTNKKDFTILSNYVACGYRNAEIMIPFLIKSGWDIHHKEKFNHRTLLHLSASHSSLETFKLILALNLDINALSKSECTPFHFCHQHHSKASSLDLQKMTLLMEKGSRIGEKDISFMVTMASGVSMKKSQVWHTHESFRHLAEAAIKHIKDWSVYRGWNICHFLAEFNLWFKIGEYPLDVLEGKAWRDVTPLNLAFDSDNTLTVYVLLEAGVTIPNDLYLDFIPTALLVEVYRKYKDPLERKRVLDQRIDEELIKLEERYKKAPSDRIYGLRTIEDLQELKKHLQ